MRAIERVRAVQAISSTMFQTMSFDDVHVFFAHEGIQLYDPEEFEHGSYNLKDLIRGYLKNCNNQKLIEIADQLELGLTITDQQMANLGESSYWLGGYFRLFISHVHTHKDQAARLKSSLQKYGISCFVAHEDIHVSAEWRTEIFRSLISMDGLIAIVSSDFNDSHWTDQEVGFAVGRGVLVIPIDKGLAPYGFLEQFQSFKTNDKTVQQVVDTIFDTIANNKKTKEPLFQCLVNILSMINNAEDANSKVDALVKMSWLTESHWSKIRSGVLSNSQLMDNKTFLESINKHLIEYNLDPLQSIETFWSTIDNEIPF